MTRKPIFESLPNHAPRDEVAADVDALFGQFMMLAKKHLDRSGPGALSPADVITAAEFFMGYVLVRLVGCDRKNLRKAVQHHCEGIQEIADAMLDDFAEHVAEARKGRR